MDFLTKNSFLHNLDFAKSENLYSINFISPLYGSSKSFAVKDLLEKNEQLVLLLSDIKLVNETKVELSVLGFAESLIVIDDFKFGKPKTKDIAAVLGVFGLNKALIVDGENKNLELASRNLRKHKFLRTEGVNVYDVVNHEGLVLSKNAVQALAEKLANEKRAKSKA